MRHIGEEGREERRTNLSVRVLKVCMCAAFIDSIVVLVQRDEAERGKRGREESARGDSVRAESRWREERVDEVSDEDSHAIAPDAAIEGH